MEVGVPQGSPFPTLCMVHIWVATRTTRDRLRWFPQSPFEKLPSEKQSITYRNDSRFDVSVSIRSSALHQMMPLITRRDPHVRQPNSVEKWGKDLIVMVVYYDFWCSHIDERVNQTKTTIDCLRCLKEQTDAKLKQYKVFIRPVIIIASLLLLMVIRKRRVLVRTKLKIYRDLKIQTIAEYIRGRASRCQRASNTTSQFSCSTIVI